MFSTIAAVTDMNFDIAIGALTGAMPHPLSLDCSSVCVRVVDLVVMMMVMVLVVMMDWGPTTRESRSRSVRDVRGARCRDSLVGEATLQRGPILRDTSFFLLVATVMLIIIFSGSFALWESSLLLLAYAVYVVTLPLRQSRFSLSLSLAWLALTSHSLLLID